jgi:peptidyl-prolyl cis-trans isomerase A (cyclophilin A)
MHSSLSRFLAAVFAAAAVFASGAALAQKVRLQTTMGDIVIELDAAKAPKSVANFVQYVKAGQYDGTIFHRVINNFMIQGGGMTADMKEKETRAPIPLESRNGLMNQRGTVAMARTTDPNSATAQFFINVANNTRLDFRSADQMGYGYTVFGKVVDGMDIVNKIAKAPKGATGAVPPGINAADVPSTQVVIKGAKVIGG